MPVNIVSLEKRAACARGQILAKLGSFCMIQEHYGKDNEASIQKIKDVYVELDVERVFKEYEQASYEKLTTEISAQKELPAEVFTALLKKIYKRQK